MKKWTFLFIFIQSISLIANCQIYRNDVKSVLTNFLKNSYNGQYHGWSGNSKDSLRLDATEYIDRIKSIDKNFRIIQGDNSYIIFSYSLDSIVSYPDYSIGFVSIVDIANGYVLNRLSYKRQITNKRYLLIKKNGNWFVLSETKDWFVSVSAYIEWAEKYLSDKTLTEGYEYKFNVILNLMDFKELKLQNN
jgi:hypothetical protein